MACHFRQLTFIACLTVVAQQAPAQTSSEVKFAPGNYGTMLSGEITGHEYRDYTLGANAGQEMFVELTPKGTAYVNILPPGSDGVAIYVGSMDDDRSEVVKLPETGTYTLRVYLMGNDKDAGHTVGYTLDVSIQ